MTKKTKTMILMAEFGKTPSEIGRKLHVTRQRVSEVLKNYYESPVGKRYVYYTMKRYFCEVCGQPREMVISFDGIVLDVCTNCADTIMKGKKRYYQNRFDWSIHYPECIECHSTRYPHVGKGRCRLCYPKYRKLKRKDFLT